MTPAAAPGPATSSTVSDPVSGSAAATRVFLDTNVLVDCADRHDLDRQQLCRAHLLGLQESGRAVISTQVLQEFYVVATRKLGLRADQAGGFVSDFRRMPIVTVTPELVEQAITCHQADRISFWDALIVVSASSTGCTVLLTGDLNAGQAIRGLRVADPTETGSF